MDRDAFLEAGPEELWWWIAFGDGDWRERGFRPWWRWWAPPGHGHCFMFREVGKTSP